MKQSGFTLIELLVVVLIIGILAAVALPQYQKAVFKSQFTEVFVNLKTMKNALDICEIENGKADGTWDTTCSLAENLDIQIGKSNVTDFLTKDFVYSVERGALSGDENIAVSATSKNYDVCVCLYDDGHFATNSKEGGDVCFTNNYPNFNVAKVLGIEENDDCECC